MQPQSFFSTSMTYWKKKIVVCLQNFLQWNFLFLCQLRNRLKGKTEIYLNIIIKEHFPFFFLFSFLCDSHICVWRWSCGKFLEQSALFISSYSQEYRMQKVWKFDLRNKNINWYLCIQLTIFLLILIITEVHYM